jgi:hypothetical protein
MGESGTIYSRPHRTTCIREHTSAAPRSQLPINLHLLSLNIRPFAMDPASIGITSGVITFVGFTYQFLSVVHSIYDFASNAHLEYETLEDVTLKMKDLSSQLISHKPSLAQSNDERNMSLLASHCLDLAEEIIGRLNNTKVKKHSLIESVKAASKTLWTKGNIGRLQGKLDRCMNQLSLQLTVMMRLLTFLLVVDVQRLRTLDLRPKPASKSC